MPDDFRVVVQEFGDELDPARVLELRGADAQVEVRAAKGRWFKDLAVGGEATLEVSGQRVPVKATLVTDAAEYGRVSEAIEQKYERPRASVLAMIRPEVLPTTARLEPA